MKINLKIKITFLVLLTIGILLFNLNIADNLISFIQDASKLNFVAQSPSDGITTYFKVSLLSSLLMLLPFYFWLSLSYIKPALYDKEIKLLDKIYNISMLSIGLFLTGMSFGVIVIFQYILPYLMRFNNDMNYQLLYQSNIMIMFIFLSVIYSGLIFQTPIINYSLLKYKIIKLENLPLIRIFVLLGSMILGAVITPPDVLSQVIFTVPIYILFEVSTLIFKLNNKGGINK